MQLSIVVPCYHPPEGWEERVITALTTIVEIAMPLQLIIVGDGDDAGISDKSIQTLQNALHNVMYITYSQNRGKGYAIREGVREATGSVIIYTDIDFPYTSESLGMLYAILTGGTCDVAIGIKDDDYYTHVPKLRKVISHSLRYLIRFFLSIPISDTQCGLKGFVHAVKPVFMATTIDRYLFDLEFVRACFVRSRPLRVQAVPVHLRDGIVFRKMNLKILVPEVSNFLRILLRKRST